MPPIAPLSQARCAPASQAAAGNGVGEMTSQPTPPPPLRAVPPAQQQGAQVWVAVVCLLRAITLFMPHPTNESRTTPTMISPPHRTEERKAAQEQVRKEEEARIKAAQEAAEKRAREIEEAQLRALRAQSVAETESDIAEAEALANRIAQ